MNNENVNWNFVNYANPHTPARPHQPYYPPATPFDFPRMPQMQHMTPDHQRLPLHPAQTPYADPLQQMLPRPALSPREATPRREAMSEIFQPDYFENQERELRDSDEHEHELRADERIVPRAVNDEARHVVNDDARRVVNNNDGRKNKRDASTKGKKDDGGETAQKKKTKRKGAGSKSGEANRRTPGASDDEIEVLGGKDSKEAAITPTSSSWDDAEKLIMVKYITSEAVWPDFKVKQGDIYIHVSITRLSVIWLWTHLNYEPRSLRNSCTADTTLILCATCGIAFGGCSKKSVVARIIQGVVTGTM